jgi:hypothetical protein
MFVGGSDIDGAQFEIEVTFANLNYSMGRVSDEREMEPDHTAQRFYVRAPSVSAVRRALYRAPGGVRVIGREDRETILCSHTMDDHSLSRHWPVILSRLGKAGLSVVPPLEPQK